MDAWRHLALELFPEHRTWIEDEELTFDIYQLFFSLQIIAQELHAKQDNNSLAKIYQFAEWCWEQKKTSPDLHNAAGVAFYEHLIDDALSMQEIPNWLKPEIFDDVKILFKMRLQPAEYQELVKRYNLQHRTNFS